MTLSAACGLLVEQIQATKDARAEAKAYRELLVIALDQAHSREHDLDVLRRAYHRVLDDMRTLRSQQRAA